ncbi:MAG TPA: ParB/RepB/Spo0J family partition protein [Chloroflexota bacterium]|nr:ParB/RepB/Spo0J family partition protein [Chloroflexota bacterium]
MAFRGGLGRGLSALIPERPAGDGPALLEVAPGQVRPNPQQPRQRFEPEALRELADSIAQHGILQPLIVTALPPSDSGLQEYQLIAGERRWQAAKLAGLARVPVLVKDASPRSALELALVENVQRADLNAIEEATAYQQLQREFGLTHEDIAQRVGKSRAAVTNALRLLALPAEARAAVVEGRVSEGHARVLLSLPDERSQLRLLALIVEHQLSVRQAEEAARRLLEPAQRIKRRPEELERELAQTLGTKVSLARSRRGGRLTIHFYSDEELDALVSRLSS